MNRIVLICILATLTCCNSSGNLKEENLITPNYPPPLNNTLLANQPIETVRGFILWYSKNIDRLDSITLVNFNGGDTTKSYSVNFKGAEKYLKELKNSGFISDKYIENWRIIFKQSDESFKIFPQNSGMPEMVGCDWGGRLYNVFTIS